MAASGSPAAGSAVAGTEASASRPATTASTSASSRSGPAASPAAVATLPPEHQRALDAKALAEKARRAAEALKEPLQPFFGWGKQADEKGRGELEKQAFAKAERLFIQARDHFDKAAGRK